MASEQISECFAHNLVEVPYPCPCLFRTTISAQRVVSLDAVNKVPCPVINLQQGVLHDENRAIITRILIPAKDVPSFLLPFPLVLSLD